MVHKTKLKRISLAVCFALISWGAEAAGLGKLKVLSGLGEPLNAEIELLAASPDELSSLTAMVAPEEAYKVQGIERPALHSNIKVEIKKTPDGTPYLKLSSNIPVADPYLDMLIQVDWASGRLLREYTLLLDPPGYSRSPVNLPSDIAATVFSKPLVPSSSAVSEERPIASTIDPLTSDPVKGTKKNRFSRSARISPKAETEVSAGAKVTTVKGDTLYSIARNANVQNVSLDQVLVGIYQANKEAFIGNNMNLLKVGQIIRVPSSNELAAVPKPEATKEIKVQSSDFQAYRNKLAGIVEAEPAKLDDEANKSSGGKITKAAEDKAAPAASAPKDVVRLSKGLTPDTKALRDKLTGLQEEAAAKERTIKDSNERIAALEKQVADMQKLLVMKNQAMAEVQKNAAANSLLATPASPSKPEAAAVTIPPTPVIAPQPATAVAKSVVPAESEKPVDSTVSPPSEKKPIPVKKLVAPPTPVEEPGFFDDMNLPLIGGAVGLLALLLGWLLLRNKRRRNLDGFEKDILTSGGLKANTVFGNTLGGTLDSGDTSFLTDFSTGTGMIDTHDVDPIAEAEVYMAYGRDSQAEEILKDAIVKEPKRYELHLKLLEMYAGRKDSSAFETVAGELYSSLGTADPTWSKVAELGRSFESDNPLYEAPQVSESQTPSKTPSAPYVAGILTTESAEEALDFSVGSSDTDATSSAKPVTEDNVLDFDIDETSTQTQPATESDIFTSPTSTMQMQTAKVQDDFSPDVFDIDLAEDAAKETSQGDISDDLDITKLSLLLDAESAVASSATVKEPSLDFDKVTNLDVPDLAVPDFSVDEISFDLPEIKTTKAETEALDLPEITELPLDKTDELSVPDFAETAANPVISNPVTEEIDFSTAGQDQAFDLDLDVDFASLDAEEMTVTEIPASEADTEVAGGAAEIDLSGISLDLDATPEVSDAIASSESSEVDTKLDLVTAYMDMGDNEGARELLDEVLKEGGVQQRLKAQEILKSLS